MSGPSRASLATTLRLRAPTLEALFIQAAHEMYALAGASAKPGVLIRRPLEVRGDDHASLLLAWLRELLSTSENEDRVFFEFHIDMLSPLRLSGRAAGGLKDRVARRLALEPGLEIVIRQTPDGFETTIPFQTS